MDAFFGCLNFPSFLVFVDRMVNGGKAKAGKKWLQARSGKM
jgi:hypothetical protein